MQQQHKQLQPIHRQIETQAGVQTSFSELAKNRITAKFGMGEQEWVLYNAEVSIGLLTLRTAFPAQSRNFSDREHDMLLALWLEIFAETKPGTFREAIMHFISTDRKGFFPAPGQIMGAIEEMAAERENQMFEQYFYPRRKRQRHIDNGEPENENPAGCEL